MARRKKEVSEETFELEENLEEEVLEEEVHEEVRAVDLEEKPIKNLGLVELNAVPDEKAVNTEEYKVSYFIGNNAVLIRKESGKTISKTIPKTSNMKIGDIVELDNI